MDPSVKATLRQRHLFARISPAELLGQGERVGLSPVGRTIEVRWGDTEVARGEAEVWGVLADPEAGLTEALGAAVARAVDDGWHGVWPEPTPDGVRLWAVRLTHHRGEPLNGGPPGPWCSCCGQSIPEVGPLTAGEEGALCRSCHDHFVDLFDLDSDPVPEVPCSVCGQVKANRRQVAFAVVCEGCARGPRAYATVPNGGAGPGGGRAPQ